MLVRDGFAVHSGIIVREVGTGSQLWQPEGFCQVKKTPLLLFKKAHFHSSVLYVRITLVQIKFLKKSPDLV